MSQSFTVDEAKNAILDALETAKTYNIVVNSSSSYADDFWNHVIDYVERSVYAGVDLSDTVEQLTHIAYEFVTTELSGVDDIAELSSSEPDATWASFFDGLDQSDGFLSRVSQVYAKHISTLLKEHLSMSLEDSLGIYQLDTDGITVVN